MARRTDSDGVSDVVFTLRVTIEERERIRKAARASANRKPTAFARDAMLTAADDVLDDEAANETNQPT